jgi:hypothetical protein
VGFTKLKRWISENPFPDLLNDRFEVSGPLCTGSVLQYHRGAQKSFDIDILRRPAPSSFGGWPKTVPITARWKYSFQNVMRAGWLAAGIVHSPNVGKKLRLVTAPSEFHPRLAELSNDVLFVEGLTKARHEFPH